MPLRDVSAAKQFAVEKLIEWIRNVFIALENPDPAELALWEQFAT
jgi:hypothetical protein